MRTIIISIIISFVIFAFMTGCKSNKSTKEPESKDSLIHFNELIPAKAGNEWTYVKEDSLSSENIIVKIISVIDNDDNKIIRFSAFPFFNIPSEPDNIIVKNDGSVLLKRLSKTQLMIPSEKELMKGYTWSSQDWKGVVESLSETVKISDTLTLQNVIKINYALGYTYSVELWIAKGYGIVKWGSYRTNPPALNITYYVLKNFKF